MAPKDEARRHGDEIALRAHLTQLGLVEDQDGNYERAKELCREAMAITTRLGDPKWTGTVLRNLAMIAIHERRPTEAAAYIAEGLARVVDTGAPTIVSNFVEVTGWTAALAGEYTLAARVMGASERCRERDEGRSEIHLKSIQAEHDVVVGRLRDALGGAAFDQAWADGKALDFDDAIDEVRSLAESLSLRDGNRALR